KRARGGRAPREGSRMVETRGHGLDPTLRDRRRNRTATPSGRLRIRRWQAGRALARDRSRERAQVRRGGVPGGDRAGNRAHWSLGRALYGTRAADRSEERRVGKECRSRWSTEQ